MAIIVINPYQYAAPIGPSADPYSDYVSLLLHGNGANGSTAFTDSSSHGHTVTANGNAQISTTQSKFGGASMAFLGSGNDTATISDDAAFQYGTDDFTIEMWVYVTGFGNYFTPIIKWNGSGSSSGTRFGIYINSSVIGTDTPYVATLNYTTVQSITNSLNTWYHIAVIRSGTSFYIFRNGTLHRQAAISSSQSFTASGNVTLGGYPDGYATGRGYIDDLRITKGVARYTSNFTPPTAELPDPSDPDFDSVSLLLHGDGNNGSTTFIDSSNNNHTVTPSGNAQISTTQSKFGGASMYFDGSGDYLSIPDDTSLHLGSDDFTFEFWTYLNSTTSQLINKRTAAAGTQYLYFQVRGGSLVIWITSNGSTWDIADNFGFGNTTLSTGQWYHIALVRNGTEISTYVDGTKSPNTITTSAAIKNGGTNPLLIGVDVLFGKYLNGYIDDFRLTQGVARYTANFTPPTAPFP